MRPSGGQLKAKIGAYYILAMLCENEARGLPGWGVSRLVKFQRGYEGHALDDIVVAEVDAAGVHVALEIQAKRTLDFTASDNQLQRLSARIAGATDYPPLGSNPEAPGSAGGYLLFDFESPGAVSTLLVEALAKASLPVPERNRPGGDCLKGAQRNLLTRGL